MLREPFSRPPRDNALSTSMRTKPAAALMACSRQFFYIDKASTINETKTKTKNVKIYRRCMRAAPEDEPPLTKAPRFAQSDSRGHKLQGCQCVQQHIANGGVSAGPARVEQSFSAVVLPSDGSRRGVKRRRSSSQKKQNKKVLYISTNATGNGRLPGP